MLFTLFSFLTGLSFSGSFLLVSFSFVLVSFVLVSLVLVSFILVSFVSLVCFSPGLVDSLFTIYIYVYIII